MKFNSYVLSVSDLSKSVDRMLGGGVQVGQITEFVGPPGVGKTSHQVIFELG